MPYKYYCIRCNAESDMPCNCEQLLGPRMAESRARIRWSQFPSAGSADQPQSVVVKFARLHDEAYKPVGRFFDALDALITGVSTALGPILFVTGGLAIAVGALWGFIALVHALWRIT